MALFQFSSGLAGLPWEYLATGDVGTDRQEEFNLEGTLSLSYIIAGCKAGWDTWTGSRKQEQVTDFALKLSRSCCAVSRGYNRFATKSVCAAQRPRLGGLSPGGTRCRSPHAYAG